jgi:hypothetical protein
VVADLCIFCKHINPLHYQFKSGLILKFHKYFTDKLSDTSLELVSTPYYPRGGLAGRDHMVAWQ